MRVIGLAVVLSVMVACVAGAGGAQTAPALPTITYQYETGGAPTNPTTELRYRQPMIVAINGVPEGQEGGIVVKFEDKKLFENIDVKQWAGVAPEKRGGKRKPVQREYVPKGDWLTVRVTQKDEKGTETELWTNEFPVYGRLAVTPSTGLLYVSLEDEDAQGHARRRAPLFPQAAVSIFKVRPGAGGQTSATFGFATGDHTVYFAGVGRAFGNDIRVVPGINFVYGQVDRPNADRSGVEARWKAGWGFSLSFVIGQF